MLFHVNAVDDNDFNDLKQMQTFFEVLVILMIVYGVSFRA